MSQRVHFVPSRRKLLQAGLAALPAAAVAGACAHTSSQRTPGGDTMKLDEPGEAVRAVALEVTRGLRTPRDKALALFSFMRDGIAFGFTPRFDRATPEETLRFGRGHCNPQAALFTALLHAVGLEARQHFVTLSNAVLDGLFPERASPPARITHSYTEVRLDGAWVPLDGYILDRSYHRAATALLRRQGRVLGLGAHRDGLVDWDGSSPCFSQMADPAMVLADHGATTEPERFYASPDYAQRLGVVGGLLFRAFAVDPANARIDSIRSGQAAG